MVVNPTLPQIAALVRAGAVDRGWALFEAGGYADRVGDPAALALKGRLLKARGRRQAGTEQQATMLQAAAAYAAANAIDPAPYLAINAATLQLLAGKVEDARSQALAVLAMLDAPEPPADTPYYLAATRAEALLLLRDEPGASQAMEAAVAHDPDGWDDRAITVAQLREICAATGADAAWLGRFTPPDSLHFAGHMGISSGGASEAALSVELDDMLAGKQIGFAWGALAAGADIIIAERLLALGVEVHAVLPCPVPQFEAQSVAPAGDQWTRRFHTVLDAANSVRIAAQVCATSHDPLATAFAGELAIGGALLNAARLGTGISQLIVCDEAGGGQNTARQAGLWHSGLGEQYRLTVPRDVAVTALFPPEIPDPARMLALHVAIGVDDLATGSPASARIEALTAPIAKALTKLPPGSLRVGPGLWEFATADIETGLAAIADLLASDKAASLSIGAHLAIGTLLADPASGTVVPYGLAPGTARALMRHAQPGTALASDDLAVTLAARRPWPVRTELWLPEEHDLGGAVHTLLARDQ